MSSLTRAAEKREDAERRKSKREDQVILTALSQRFHFTPATSLTTPHDPSAPKLILLFGWLGARLRHIQKYADGYHKLYPTSPIIIVRSFHPDMHPFSRFGREFQALVVLLQLHNIDITRPDNGVLMQAFSNGGCWSISALIHQYSKAATCILQPRAMIFDSCPGRARFSVFIKAFISAGNLGLLGKLFWTPIVTTLYFAYKAYCRIRGRDPFGERRRQMLHHVRGQNRVYIFSKEDQLINYEDVLSHADLVRNYKVGQEEVHTEEFHGSDHVAHLRLDERRYWNIVQKAWDPDFIPIVTRAPSIASEASDDSIEPTEEVNGTSIEDTVETGGLI